MGHGHWKKASCDTDDASWLEKKKAWLKKKKGRHHKKGKWKKHGKRRRHGGPERTIIIIKT